MKTPIYTKRKRLNFVFKITALTCLLVLGGIYVGFSPNWAGLPKTLSNLLIFGLCISILIAAPTAYWASDLLRQNYVVSRDLAKRFHMDQLSGAMSRAYLDNFIKEFPNLSGVILMIDVDNFKSINDTHGHIVGDYAISQIGKMIKSNIREADSFYRFGGEEFVVFLSDTSQYTGHDIAARICLNIARTPIIHGHEKLFVTVSIGGAMKGETNAFQTTLARADKNLYHVKQTGRNNVYFAESPPLSKH